MRSAAVSLNSFHLSLSLGYVSAHSSCQLSSLSLPRSFLLLLLFRFVVTPAQLVTYHEVFVLTLISASHVMAGKIYAHWGQCSILFSSARLTSNAVHTGERDKWHGELVKIVTWLCRLWHFSVWKLPANSTEGFGGLPNSAVAREVAISGPIVCGLCLGTEPR